MGYIDPWRGTNEGLATLRGTFSEIDASRIRREEMDRQARQDALNEPYLRTRNELAGMELGEKQRAISNLQEYDAVRKVQEEGFSTATVPTTLPNPNYLPEREQAGPTLPRDMDVGEGVPVSVQPDRMPNAPAQGLPTMEGKVPMGEDAKTQARLMLAIKHGRLDDAMKIGQFVDLTDKIDARQVTKIQNVMKAINSIRTTMGPQVALAQGKKLAVEMGMDPALAAQMVISPQGIVSVPDAQGGTIVNFTDPDGKVHVFYNKPEKSDAFDREKFGITSTETKRHNLAMEGKGASGRGGETALMKNTKFLESLGYDKKVAAALLSSSKPMSRETFIGQATLRVMNNTFIPEVDKPAAIQQAIDIFDSSVKKGAAPTTDKVLDKATATSILQEAGGDKDKARKLAKDRGYKF